MSSRRTRLFAFEFQGPAHLSACVWRCSTLREKLYGPGVTRLRDDHPGHRYRHRAALDPTPR